MKIEELMPSRYKIGPLLSNSGQSRVFDSTDLLTGERVAVKYIERKQGTISAGLKEISALFTINHPNILPCIDFHYLENGSCIIVNEFQSGGSLRDYLGEGKVVPSEIWEKCAHDILKGLRHLHNKNLIHRDLKPENILIENPPNDDLPHFKIADFGLAQHNKEALRGGRTSCGSPAYMAPEAYNGSTSPSSDLYSLGVILFEMTTACRPFNDSIQTLAKAHASEAPDLNLIQTKGVAPFIGQLLEKHIDHRFKSADHALQVLASCMGSLLHQANRSSI